VTERKEFFGVTEIYCKRNVKDCRNCFDPRCKYRTEKYTSNNIKRKGKSIKQ